MPLRTRPMATAEEREEFEKWCRKPMSGFGFLARLALAGILLLLCLAGFLSGMVGIIRGVIAAL